MNLLAIAVRAVFSYGLLLGLVRLRGKRGVRQAGAFDRTLTLILGDLVDNAIFGEAPLAAFGVAAGSMVAIHLLANRIRAAA